MSHERDHSYSDRVRIVMIMLRNTFEVGNDYFSDLSGKYDQYNSLCERLLHENPIYNSKLRSVPKINVNEPCFFDVVDYHNTNVIWCRSGEFPNYAAAYEAAESSLLDITRSRGIGVYRIYNCNDTNVPAF